MQFDGVTATGQSDFDDDSQRGRSEIPLARIKTIMKRDGDVKVWCRR